LLNIQGSLYPWLTEELALLTKKQQELVATLGLVRIEEFIYFSRGFPGLAGTGAWDYVANAVGTFRAYPQIT
jgi:hypothetical protein